MPALSRQITTPADLNPLSLPELEALRLQHDLEIISLEGSIEAAKLRGTLNPDWHHRALGALRALRLHRAWLGRAINVAQAQAAHAARAARQQADASNDTRFLAALKAAAREALPPDTYASLIATASQRCAAAR